MFTNMTKHKTVSTILSVYESNDKTILTGQMVADCLVTIKKQDFYQL
jgi:hypothetical protein